MPVVRELTITSNLRNYQVKLCDDDSFIADFASQANTVFIVDENVWRLHQNTTLRLLKDPIILPISEEGKSLESVQLLYDQVISLSAKKNMTLVSIGGGITQDITGFVASTLYRGVNWIFVPTTLLAQADSCIGAKTSLNYKKYKNLLGTFFPPHQVYIYPGFLDTLDEPVYLSGLGEIVKLYVIGGEQDTLRLLGALPALLNRQDEVLLNFVMRSLTIKKDYIEADEFDTGKRNMLNFGHCFGHAVEYATGYALAHGQAVVVGMILAGFVARERGLLQTETEQMLRAQLLIPVLGPEFPKLELDHASIIEAMKQDKKRVGADLPLIMVTDGYAMVKVTDLKVSEVHQALDFFTETGL
ncbi:hypothetical protein AUK40_04885 [Candidatus Wirthbacteria bacterium CG2_30_54_11]|uniref:Uncharacterized protein n=1 Tax=Candidatus Wirthbacteria bacterium CG2_30_54_11 TaxID=1817892 RepID=A0A1J5IHG5_9BACT|nr:MAG: hypothetical protein AUK40_04885 [Candidatus Wirthbacteria bacterium CG2_30_54_11]